MCVSIQKQPDADEVQNNLKGLEATNRYIQFWLFWIPIFGTSMEEKVPWRSCFLWTIHWDVAHSVMTRLILL
jgi:hypothetical protein